MNDNIAKDQYRFALLEAWGELVVDGVDYTTEAHARQEVENRDLACRYPNAQWVVVKRTIPAWEVVSDEPVVPDLRDIASRRDVEYRSELAETGAAAVAEVIVPRQDVTAQHVAEVSVLPPVAVPGAQHVGPWHKGPIDPDVVEDELAVFTGRPDNLDDQQRVYLQTQHGGIVRYRIYARVVGGEWATQIETEIS